MKTMEIVDSAVDLYELDYAIHPLHPNSKRPIYNEWPQLELTDNDIKHFWSAEQNIGLITGERSGVVVIDFDDKEAGRRCYAEHNIWKTIVETKKGVHFWMRWTEEVRNGKHEFGDIRGDGGYVVVPDSVVDGWQYKYVDGHGLVGRDELPPFDPSVVA